MSQAIVVRKTLAESLKEHLRKRPFSKISVEDICQTALVSRRSFYRQFRDKYELLNWLYDYEFCRFVDERSELTIWDYYPDICRHLYSDREFFLNAFSVTGQNSFRDFCNDKLYPLLMNDFGHVFPDERVARFVIKRITDASFDGFQWWLGQSNCMPLGHYAEYAIRTGKARRVTREEYMARLKDAEERGYVHNVSNHDGPSPIEYICNCDYQTCMSIRASSYTQAASRRRCRCTATHGATILSPVVTGGSTGTSTRTMSAL